MRDQKWKILLVEDDEDDYILTQALLSEARGSHVELTWASSYPKALAAFRQAEFDVLIIDYRLGKRDGLELVRELNGLGNTTPVILMTGQGNYAIDLEAMQAGATDYLVKSEVSAQVLERTLRYAIERKAAENELRAANAALGDAHAALGDAHAALGDAHAALRSAHDGLELRVQERTEQLRQANDNLEAANQELRREIGERQRAQQALEASELRFRKLAETTSSAIFIVREMAVLYANPAAQTITGFSNEELLNMPFWQIAHPSYQEVIRRNGVTGQWMSHLVGDIPTRYELKLRTRNGQERWVDITAGTLAYEGEPALVVTAFDITERDLAEQELRKAKNELEVRVARRTAELLQANGKLAQSNEWLEQANQRLAHELEQRERGVSERVQAEEQIRVTAARVEVQQRLIEQREEERLRIAQDLHDGPLQELLAHTYELEVAALRCQEGELRQRLGTIGRNLHHMIGELRDLTSELRPPALESLGLETALRSHADKFREKYPHIELSMDIPTAELALPAAVSLALFRILQEALNNVVHHANATEVRVSLVRQPGEASLHVEDNGRGFEPPENWVEAARLGRLGLVGARERAQALGGRLQVHSRPGRGTQVHALIPVD